MVLYIQDELNEELAANQNDQRLRWFMLLYLSEMCFNPIAPHPKPCFEALQAIERPGGV